ncbi:hypothetical protein HMPREF0444_0051 [Granulicatella adiacens ATCC 49175]|uniref:Uncharacterized protein n=1 Tax=Granulicatella adiacens ATCC 49175 TaxID=638301 RepID=C8NDQ6_9LACT|nr:hypothetical protein HMPREF0444_0051 [Granulicatella adiacens ATCC 49175]
MVRKDTGHFIENGLGATKVIKLLRLVLDKVQKYLANAMYFLSSEL